MNLINHKNKIYLEYYTSSKLVKRSLNLEYNQKNLKYAKTTLLPLFLKISAQKNSKKLLPKRAISRSIKNVKYAKTLKEFCDEILLNLTYTAKKGTINSAKYSIRRFFDFIDNKEITAYSIKDMQMAVFRMKKESLSAKTINLLLTYPNLAFKKAKQQNIIKENPFLFVKKPKETTKPKVVFSKKQISNILENAKGELKTFLYIAFYTGARCGEILALNGDDIDILNATIYIEKNQARYELTTPKNGKTRQIVAPKELVVYLKNALGGFMGSSNKLFYSDYFQIYYEFKKLLKALDYPLCGLHTTRHTYTTHLMKNCISPMFIANNLGHSNLDLVNRIYSHYLFDKKEIKKINEKIKF
ncbi:site-specific tyrosine recombinase, phage integrase family (INT_ICEBs1_C_like domain) [Campylobacter blaseri]|uniref:Tyr recombinase domain-containing protein n=1 Tax=Campylobacter blaseri TaxID=2042961 RepID=A0A2P8R3X4_9BACT|nr:tyrosine-type recombinase/integrase [Campylobacter blaseri]PSM53214.1 hypothetical protein CQ405_01310 [Campylobacter blaseri]PSM54680.1 hypothetical protein CRN67_01310 [Campylobacter blaseri]QKF86842.1 site-specific tyrosine recombinase, phage integrase family (INT_ICEBs1_C_like domain) [Campylobacter blaseri]